MVEVLRYTPDTIAPGFENARLITPNEVGAEFDDGEAEAKLRFLSEHLGIVGLGFERPYSASRSVYNLSLRARHVSLKDNYYQMVSQTGADLAQHLDADDAIDSVVVVGHSAAAMFGTALVASEQFAVDTASFTDPYGMVSRTPMGGIGHYLGYQLIREGVYRRWFHSPAEDVDTSTNAEAIAPSEGLLHTARFVGEIGVYSGLGRLDEPTALHSLRHIAEQQPSVETHVEFPEFSVNGHLNKIAPILGELKMLRSPEDGFHVHVHLDRYHSHYNSHANHLAAINSHLESHPQPVAA